MFFCFFALKCKFWFSNFEKGIFAQLFSYTAFIAINIVTDQINWNIDKVVLGRYCGTVIVAVYSVGATLQSYYQMFSLAISNVFIPRIHSIVNNRKDTPEEKYAELTNIFIKVGRIQYLILALVMSGLIFFGKEFIFLWAGPGYENAYYVALLLMIPVTVPLIQNIGTEIQRSLNKHQLRSILYFFMALLNFVITLSLSRKYGEIGAAAGTTISLILSTGIIMNFLYMRVIHIDIVRFWKNILSVSLGLMTPVCLMVIVKLFVDFSSIPMFIIGILGYSAVYALSMYRFGMNQYERELFTKPVLRILGKGRYHKHV